MISIKLEGGLGNQLFQLQAALILVKNSSDICIDISNLEKTHDGIGIKGFKLSDKDISHYFSNLGIDVSIVFFKSSQKYMKFISNYNSRNILDSNEMYPSELILENKSSDLNLSGYFQSFVLSDTFRDNYLDFSKISLTKESRYYKNIVKMIKSDDPIVLHVRHGDYFLSGDRIGVLSEEYYLNCLEEMNVSANEKVFIYSDSIKKIEKDYRKLKDKFDLFFIPNSQRAPAAHLLKAITYASRHIISNSTFSWWAAYLSKSSQVLTPNRFYRNIFNNEERNPPSWKKMDSKWV